ncbi:MAG: rhodanese-like domain-containing protein [Candidatus Izemoplasmataceae bacterium]
MRLKWLFSLILIVSILTSCTNKNTPIPINFDDEITMVNLDLYMERDEVQYVDLRNFDAKFAAGYIDGFEMIPFFDYLDNRAFDRNHTYMFDPNQILNEDIMTTYFDQEKTIFLYADGCIRADYVREVLLHLGYEKVFTLGGYFEYNGDFNILGDSSYEIGRVFYQKVTVNHQTYLAYGRFEMDQTITEIHFDLFDEDGNSIRQSNTEIDVSFDTLESYIVKDVVTFNDLYDLLNNEMSPYYQLDTVTINYHDGLISLINKLQVKP